MKVKMRVQLTGTRDGEDWPPKDAEMDLPDDEARDLIHSGLAEPVVKDKTEKATAPKGEERKSGLTTKSGLVASDEK